MTGALFSFDRGVWYQLFATRLSLRQVTSSASCASGRSHGRRALKWGIGGSNKNLGFDSPFSAIVLFKTSCFTWAFDGFLKIQTCGCWPLARSASRRINGSTLGCRTSSMFLPGPIAQKRSTCHRSCAVTTRPALGLSGA